MNGEIIYLDIHYYICIDSPSMVLERGFERISVYRMVFYYSAIWQVAEL